MGIAFDNQGRLFVSSDSSGEIYVVVRDEETNKSSTGANGGGGSRDESGQVSEGMRERWIMGVKWVALGVLMRLVVI